jgi:predicted O-methyltransferase YrrM
VSADLRGYLETVDSIPGWFYANDAALFLDLSAHQRDRGQPGDLLEIGTYLGKSAVLLGFLLGPGERLVVCDLFEGEAASAEARREKDQWYSGLARDRFEENYRRHHDRLPEVVAGPSTELDRLGPDGSFRFVHVDGGHQYDVVRHDLKNARRLLAPGGVVAIDDWRSVHTPGVIAAAWEAVVADGLVPFCITEQKLYGSWDPASAPSAEDVEGWVAARPDMRASRYRVMERDLVWVTVAETSEDPPPRGLRARLSRRERG